jgi:hypothetical protein
MIGSDGLRPREYDFEGEFKLPLAEGSNTSCCLSRIKLCGSIVNKTDKSCLDTSRIFASSRPMSNLFDARFSKTFTVLETIPQSSVMRPLAQFCTDFQKGKTLCQDDCINMLSWPKCFNETSSPHSVRRKLHNFQLGLINCAEALRQRSCGIVAEREENWSKEAAAIAAMLVSR